MSNVRRFEEKGLVYVRGYKTDERQTPFKRGYLITWLYPQKPREEAIKEAVRRTDEALEGKLSGSPLMERVHRVRDMIIEHSKLRKLVSFTYLRNKLDCTPYKAERALSRATQLYPDLKEIKLFGAYRYYYHTSLARKTLRKLLQEYHSELARNDAMTVLKPKDVALAVLGNYQGVALQASYALTEAKYSILKAVNERPAQGLNEANETLKEASLCFSEGQYDSAIQMAFKAKEIAEVARMGTQESGFSAIVNCSCIAKALVIVACTVLRIRGKSRRRDITKRRTTS